MHDKAEKSIGLMALMAYFALVVSFLFPGFRIAGIPVSLPSLISLLCVPSGLLAYRRSTRWLVLGCLAVLGGLQMLSALRFGFEFRSVLFLLMPLSAVGCVALAKVVVDRYGIDNVLRATMWLCGVNVLIMLLQATDPFGLSSALLPLWLANIDFVTSAPEQREILELTISIRPPGLFPTGIFASTAIYVACRAVYVQKGVVWPLLLALLAILLTANRTLALFFFVFETVAFVRAFGFLRFLGKASVLVPLGGIALALIALFSGELYLFQFLGQEMVAGDVESTASVVERLKTVEYFIEYAPQYAVFGGFSNAQLLALGHVFDSEILLRVLQFGVIGVLALALIILAPRKGRPSASWNFLFALALVASITTTFATSVIYTFVIALYKEALTRRTKGARLEFVSWAPAISRVTRSDSGAS